MRSTERDTGSTFYAYDDRDNLITEHYSVPEGAMSYAGMRYRYLYDKEGNWIQKKTAFESGEIKEVTTRIIVYWP